MADKYMNTISLAELWTKCKAWFGRKLTANSTATQVTVTLLNNGGDTPSSITGNENTATIPAATQSLAGVMTAADKVKLDGIDSGAQANAVTSVNGETGAVVLEASDIMNGTYSVAADIEELQENLGDATALAYRNSDLYVATCSTAAATAAKVATVINSQSFTLETGAMVLVWFSNANVGGNITLNVNSTGAKTVAYPTLTGVGTSSDIHKMWQTKDCCLFVYDGNYWVFMGSISATMTIAEAAMPKSGGTFTGAPKYASDPADNNTLTRKSYVDNAISSAIGDITGISYQVVATLPATGEAGVIYLVSNSGSAPNIYDEYIWTGSAFEKIGTTDVDLSGYWATSDLVAMTAAEVDAICV